MHFDNGKDLQINDLFYRVKWFGSHPPTTGKTCADASKELWDGSKSKITRDSTSRTQYRHYAYDSTHDIIYFCDLNPYKEGMFCYCSDRNEPGNVWNGKFFTIIFIVELNFACHHPIIN